MAPLISLLDDGLVALTGRYGELTMPLLLFTSRQDHVVDPSQSEHLANTYGGDVDHRWLERSYHVATQDYDRHDIIAAAVEFAVRRTASSRRREEGDRAGLAAEPGHQLAGHRALSLNAYGLMIALGIVAAVWLFGRRIEAAAGQARGRRAVGLWAVVAGVIGARLYHVITDWQRFDDNLGAIPRIWEGGLGIPVG